VLARTVLCVGLALGGGLTLGGCAVDANDLQTWKGVVGGSERLAGYYHDAKRPLELRAVAAQALFDLDHLDQIMGVIREAPTADRPALLGDLARISSRLLLDPQTAITDRARAAGLGYSVLEFREGVPETERGTLLDALLAWALDFFGKEPPNLPKTPTEILSAVAVADAPRARAAIKAWLTGDVDDRVVQVMVDLARKLRDPELDLAMAEQLLARAKADHPALSPQRVDLLLANGNPTLLRYLLASVGDVRVPFAARATAMNEVSRRLKGAALDQYLALLPIDDPANGNQARLMALDLVWEYAGVERLADALRALPAQGTWPTEGEDLRAQIREFCDASLARNKVAARPVLIQLLADESWVARAYALECVIRLYPDEAIDLLDPYADDPTPLPGWSLEGETSIGAVVQALRGAE
jgi:hypothetical protein